MRFRQCRLALLREESIGREKPVASSYRPWIAAASGSDGVLMEKFERSGTVLEAVLKALLVRRGGEG